MDSIWSIPEVEWEKLRTETDKWLEQPELEPPTALEQTEMEEHE